jgi:hypothetical protein
MSGNPDHVPGWSDLSRGNDLSQLHVLGSEYLPRLPDLSGHPHLSGHIDLSEPVDLPELPIVRGLIDLCPALHVRHRGDLRVDRLVRGHRGGDMRERLYMSGHDHVR